MAEIAIVGARAAVFKDVESWTVVGDNPAKVFKQRVLTGRRRVILKVLPVPLQRGMAA